MSAYSLYRNEFSKLLESPLDWAPADLNRQIPRIGRAGISILFPPAKVQGFLQLIATELILKQQFVSAKQTVCHLRLRGFPLRQCTVEEITELLFRLCSRYRIQEANLGERKIDLTLDQCSSDHLALLKGLGFNHIHILVEASIAAPDRSLDGVKRAIGAIRNFDGFRISGEVIYSADTSREYLDNLITYLFECRLDEIEFFRNANTLTLPGELQLTRQTFRFLAETLKNVGYRLVGDRCFKCESHPDLVLLGDGKLGYGPWGFYNQATTEWLGLGPGADGMIAGFMYHNSLNIDTYRDSVSEQQSPVCSWSRNPMEKELAFRFIQSLYCEHRVQSTFFIPCGGLLKKLKALGWMTERDGCCTLSEEGILHLATICNLYSLHQAMDGKC